MNKVISVNIYPGEVDETKGYKEIEFEELNKYLQQGWLIKDKFSTVPNGTNSVYFTITFILYK